MKTNLIQYSRMAMLLTGGLTAPGAAGLCAAQDDGTGKTKDPTECGRREVREDGAGENRAFVVENAGDAATGRRPNVVYIMADDLGYGDISPYGQERILTPNLDALAAQGRVFTQAYAGCTVSAPSRASLMTGLHTGHTFIRGNREIKPEGQQPMPADTYTLGKLFREAGYATGAFGKWGLGYPGSESDPLKMGFEEFFGYNCQRKAHSYYPDHLWNNDTKVEYPENVDPGRVTYSQDIIHEHALEFIREHADGPFFAYLAYTLPHAELCLPHDAVYDYYVEKFKDEEADAKAWLTNGDYGTSEHPMASFAAMVTRLDKYVGDVMALLEEEGVADNTLLIFTSDNGPHREGGANPDFFRSYGPLRGCKRDLYEGGIRIPFIVRWPGKVAEGSTSDVMIAFWDMLPTFADLISGGAAVDRFVPYGESVNHSTAGSGAVDSGEVLAAGGRPCCGGAGNVADSSAVDSGEVLAAGGRPCYSAPIVTDGVSVLPAFTGSEEELHPWLYWEFHELGGRQAVRMGQWKGIRLKVGTESPVFELYDLSNDIHEDNNVAEQYPEISGQIQQIMDEARTHSDLFNFR